MTQTIEQLQAKVAELEEENARLKAECDDIKQVQFPRKLEAVAVGWKKQLAAEQLNNQLLRDALNQWIGIASNCSIESGCCCCGESIENHSHPMTCGHSPVDMADSVVHEAINRTDKALSLTASTEALNELIEKVERLTIERCVTEIEETADMVRIIGYSYRECLQVAIRALPVGQIKLEELL